MVARATLVDVERDPEMSLRGLPLVVPPGRASRCEAEGVLEGLPEGAATPAGEETTSGGHRVVPPGG